MTLQSCWHVFAELIRTPFEHLALIWGIVPLYFGLLFSEITAEKASFRTAFQTGFSFLWAGLQWSYPYYSRHRPGASHIEWQSLLAVNAVVTLLVLVLGVMALISGIRRRFPRFGSFLGHTRFSNYFMIAIYPIQAQHLEWSWERLVAIVVFAVPIWLALHFGLKPLRK
ncbi:MAG TPA: hypothetical protein VN673_19330 [Clostridia bacterium]|nr:hypothetical protein [Clostridia bacterium]